MPESGDLTRPEVRCPARLHPDTTRRSIRKERSNLAATQAPAHDNVPGLVNPVELENVLREIDADGGNVAHGWFLFLVILDDHQLGTQMP
jgi:hypothetical protein